MYYKAMLRGQMVKLTDAYCTYVVDDVTSCNTKQHLVWIINDNLI